MVHHRSASSRSAGRKEEGNGEGGQESFATAAVADLPPWLQPEFERLLHLHDRQRLHHALLLTGRTGLGKRLLAGVLARSLLCEERAGRPCEHCRACQLTAAGSHPDFRAIGPRQGGDRGEIVIDSVRALVDFLHLSAQRRGNRVAVILPCDRLNRAAANSLLKSLEEPPDGVYLILATGRPGRLPATIRSRCAVRTLGPPEAQQAEEWLHRRQPGAGRDAIRKALALAGDMPLAAEGILAEHGLERYESLLQQFHRLAAGGDPVKEAQDWEQAPGGLADGLCAILADLIRRHHGAPPKGLASGELEHRIATQAGIPAQSLHQAYLTIAEHRRSLDQPLNGRLAAEAILLDLSRTIFRR